LIGRCSIEDSERSFFQFHPISLLPAGYILNKYLQMLPESQKILRQLDWQSLRLDAAFAGIIPHAAIYLQMPRAAQ